MLEYGKTIQEICEYTHKLISVVLKEVHDQAVDDIAYEEWLKWIRSKINRELFGARQRIKKEQSKDE